MTTLRHLAKHMAGDVMLHTGLWQRHLERMARRGKAIVLTYHRVIEKWDRTLDYSQPGMVVTANTFERQLAFLKKYFNIVPLSYLTNPKPEVRNSKSNRPLCAITFDDGWRDNYEVAYPILRHHNLPATIFLTTDFIGTNRAFWHTELMYVLMHGDPSRFRLVQYVAQAYPSTVGRHWRGLVRLRGVPTSAHVDSLIEAVKATCSEEQITRMVRDLRYSIGTSASFLSQRRFFLDWDQVRTMAAEGIEIGSHGCTHRMMTRLHHEEVQAELVRSKREIERQISRMVQHFAFPHGAVNRELMVMAGKAGYRTACLNRTSIRSHTVRPLALSRVAMNEGVSKDTHASFSPSNLLFWIFWATRIRPCPRSKWEINVSETTRNK